LGVAEPPAPDDYASPRPAYSTPLVIRGEAYALVHLDPFTFAVASDKVPRPLLVNVRFTSHCYTDAFDATRHPADEPAIMDGVRRRAFAPVRYALSHRLPALIRSLADPRAKVRETSARRNWMYSAVVDIPAEGTRYAVFFELRRTPAERRRLSDLELVVESAYPMDPARPEPNILGAVGFVLLAGTIFLGKRVSTRR
jgi:hypothetical protein